MKSKYVYNRIFIPEYFSTIVISIMVTLSTGFWFSNSVKNSDNFHKVPSVVVYTFIIILILGLSVYYRRKYNFFYVDDKGIERTANWYTLPFIGFDEVFHIEESKGEFFGKTSRFLRLELKNGEIIQIYDFIYKYCEIKAILERKKGKIKQSVLLKQGHFVNFANENYRSLEEKLSEESKRRDAIFGDPTNYYHMIIEFFRRLFCLLPVCFTDFCLKILIDSYFGGKKNPPSLSYYSSVISLFVSVMVARYVYFYLFSYEKWFAFLQKKENT